MTGVTLLGAEATGKMAATGTVDCVIDLAVAGEEHAEIIQEGSEKQTKINYKKSQMNTKQKYNSTEINYKW